MPAIPHAVSIGSLTLTLIGFVASIFLVNYHRPSNASEIIDDAVSSLPVTRMQTQSHRVYEGGLPRKSLLPGTRIRFARMCIQRTKSDTLLVGAPRDQRSVGLSGRCV